MSKRNFPLHPEVRSFWEQAGYKILTWEDIYFDIDGVADTSSNELYWAAKDDIRHLIADVSVNSWYYYQGDRFREEEILKILRD